MFNCSIVQIIPASIENLPYKYYIEMILIADSGSTKTDWRLIDNQKKSISFSSNGLNPYFVDDERVKTEILTHYPKTVKYERIEKIFFYGAGCSSPDKCQIVKNGLSKVFPLAEISIYHDLLGAARALFFNESGIAVILGTGSNSGYYNGNAIIQYVPSLGYILGDEGSGAFMGKQLLKDFLYKDLPQELHKKFLKKFNLTKEDILQAVYNEPFPNRFLASFTKFLSENISHPFIRDIITFSFSELFKKQLCKYPSYKHEKIGCTGSIAYYFSDLLKQTAMNFGADISQIIEFPITNLIKYHEY
ncbi:MAG: hypothetical protein HY738_02485 [Bacteroidia bacterium]|nr:hypothetical protein [Bacteroidia bacterium]